MAISREPSEAYDSAIDTGEELFGDDTKRMKLSQRQRELNERWAFFRAAEHEGKKLDWDGRRVVSGSERDAMSAAGYGNDYDPKGVDTPRNLRRPPAPFAIVHNIVSRFTGLLFSHRRLPRVAVPGDTTTEDYLNGILDHGRFWAIMAQARNHGGAMGSSCPGFRFSNGVCEFETLDPRWTKPDFHGRTSSELSRLTVQYAYSEDRRRPDGSYKKVWYWYRRVIDSDTDTTWVPVRCREEEPDWNYIRRTVIRHGLGFIPYEWIRNRDTGEDEIDGDSDCLGAYPMIQAIDTLMSEVYAGTLANCDPTLVLKTKLEFDSIRKGSDNAVRLDQGEDAQYMELQGSGPRIGIEIIKEFEERVYRLSQCVPDSVLFQNSGEKTATEIERIFASMFERADTLREQYGQAIVRICQKVLAAVRIHTAIKEVPDSETGVVRFIRGRVYVPPRVITQQDGDAVEIPRAIGKGTVCVIKWPSYQRLSWTDVDTATRVVTTMLSNDPKVLTRTTAIKMLGPILDYDYLAELQSIMKEEQQTAAEEAAAADTGGDDDATEEAPSEKSAPNPAIWKTALDGGLITINEYREEALGLGAIPDGDLTLVQYRAKHAQLFVASTAAVSEKSVDLATGKAENEERRMQEAHDQKRADWLRRQEAQLGEGGDRDESDDSAQSPEPSELPPERPSSARAEMLSEDDE